jgi:hypothetical protein
MNEAAVHFAVNHTDAEVAASALRAAGLHPRIALDTTLGLAAGLTTNSGRRVVYVRADEEEQAREVLQEPELEEPEDNPIRRLVVIVAIIVGLLLATPFVAQVCYPSG